MNSLQSLKAVAAVAVVLLGLVTVANAAQESAAEAPVTLTGTLSVDGAGGYVLVEEQSGDSITLRGPSALSDFAGAFVRVTGRWVDDPDGAYFMVEKIEEM